MRYCLTGVVVSTPISVHVSLFTQLVQRHIENSSQSRRFVADCLGYDCSWYTFDAALASKTNPPGVFPCTASYLLFFEREALFNARNEDLVQWRLENTK